MRASKRVRCEVSEATLVQVDHLVQVSRFMSTIAHELNNSLHVIRGLAELTVDDPALAPATAARLRRIMEQVDRGSASIRDLVGFARERSTAAVRTDLAVLAESVVALRHYSLSRLGVDVQIDRQAGQRFDVIGSPRELEQMVLALMLNAEGALAESNQSRRLGLAFESDERSVVLRMSDNGPGIAPALRDALFDPFTSGFSQGEHVGLGLTSARAIAEGLGGQISAENRPDVGVSVVVRLPKP